MGLDPAIRKAIMTEALGIGADPKKDTSEKVEEKPVVGDQNSLYEFRHQLKKVHAYERKIKEDSENWTEDHWEQFRESLKAPISSNNSADIMVEVLENKKNNISKEAEILHENRVELIKRMDFSLFDKLMTR